jgi:hypothetical protein
MDILKALSAQNSAPTGISQIKEFVSRLKGMSNPESLLQNMMAQRNPAMAKAVQYVNECGGDPKAAFQKLAQEQGIDASEIESLFR